MPRSLAATTSMEALNGPVDAIIFSWGSRSITSRDSGVRSRITHTTSKALSRSTTASGSSRWSLNTVIVARSVTCDQSAMVSATSW
ncbi:hypothetical protein A5658_14570 [Mycobacterium sp. 1245111.1]|nr:hypothetical protein A5658_14570 [Mycobacterium sp. 1245111.1]